MSSDSRFVVRAARLLDGVADTPREDVAVLVEDGRIASVTERCSDVSALATGARLVELGDVTLLPGLIDLHTHLTAWANRWPRPMYEEGTRYALQAASNCRAALQAGVTTIRDAGAFGDVAVATRDAVAEGVIAGPRILASRMAVTIPGGLGTEKAVAHLGRTSGWMVEATGVDGMRKAVLEQIKHTADWIKLYYEHGDWTTDELTAAVDAAHSLDVRVMCHAIRPTAIKAAIAAGVDTIEHGVEADEDDLAAMTKRGIAWVPTLLIIARSCENAIEAGADAATTQVLRWLQERHRTAFRHALALGVEIGAGVDAVPNEGIVPFPAVAEELRLMVELGMSPAAAIRAATSRAAAILRLSDELGSVQVGRCADLVAVAGDPLADIAALRDPLFVMRAGEVVRWDRPSSAPV